MKKIEVDRFPTTSEFYLTIGPSRCQGCFFYQPVGRPSCLVMHDDTFDCEPDGDGAVNNYIWKRKKRLV